MYLHVCPMLPCGNVSCTYMCVLCYHEVTCHVYLHVYPMLPCGSVSCNYMYVLCQHEVACHVLTPVSYVILR